LYTQNVVRSVGWPTPHLERATAAVLGAAVVDVVQRGLVGDVPDAVRSGGLGRLLDAAEGSEAALAQVPAEVRSLLQGVAGEAAGGGPRDGPADA